MMREIPKFSSKKVGGNRREVGGNRREVGGETRIRILVIFWE